MRRHIHIGSALALLAMALLCVSGCDKLSQRFMPEIDYELLADMVAERVDERMEMREIRKEGEQGAAARAGSVSERPPAESEVLEEMEEQEEEDLEESTGIEEQEEETEAEAELPDAVVEPELEVPSVEVPPEEIPPRTPPKEKYSGHRRAPARAGAGPRRRIPNGEFSRGGHGSRTSPA